MTEYDFKDYRIIDDIEFYTMIVTTKFLGITIHTQAMPIAKETGRMFWRYVSNGEVVTDDVSKMLDNTAFLLSNKFKKALRHEEYGTQRSRDDS